MTYILIKTVDMLPKGVERLVVEGRNKMNPAGKMALLHEVIATVYGYKVQLLANLDLVVRARLGPGGAGKAGWGMGGKRTGWL